jgi:lauroyl/myristoyl acyltransferase
VNDAPSQSNTQTPAGAGWLRALFFLAPRFPALLRLVRPLVAHGAYWASPHIRRVTALNARRILPRPGPTTRYRYAVDLVAQFFDVVVDIARSRGEPPERLAARIARVEGEPAYLASRASRRGAILATAHFGSFEAGLGALRRVEPKVNVVFKRDAFGAFDRIRSEMRATLGVRELAIDDGWQTLMALRACLEANEVVVMQADRAMPGQRSQHVRVLGGHLALPVGPVTLARLTGSPIVPVFAVPTRGGRFAVHLLPPIEVDPDAPLIDGVEPALIEVGRAIERFVAERPECWLVLEPAFVEDRALCRRESRPATT